jgi:hypothetical protein
MRVLSLVSVVVYALLGAGLPAEAGPRADPQRHVRPRDETAVLFLRFGMEKSARFRETVEALERAKVIVYIDVRMDGTRPVGGGLNYLSEVGGVRWVRAVVDSGTSSFAATCQNIVQLTSILGHELHHAREASEAPSLASEREFERYFRTIGVDDPDILDTLAARDIGATVEEELRGRAHARTHEMRLRMALGAKRSPVPPAGPPRGDGGSHGGAQE